MGTQNYFNIDDFGKDFTTDKFGVGDSFARSMNGFSLADDIGSDAGGFDWGGAASGFGSVAKGIGGLASAWQGMEGLKLAKEQLRTQNEQWEKNYQAQRGDIAHDRATRGAYRNKMRGGAVV